MSSKKKILIVVVILLSTWLALPLIKSTIRYGGPMYWYGNKARQTVAKMYLGQAYSAQKNHFKSKGSYGYEINQLELSFENNSRYIVAVPLNCQQKFAAASPVFVPEKQLHPDLSSRMNEIREYITKLSEQECLDPRSGFKLFAMGVIWPGFPLDIWSIDQNKNLEHLQDGL